MDELRTDTDERGTLTGFLDWNRALVPGKLGGVDAANATRILVPSGLSLLGVVAHLAWAERLWFQWRFAGEDIDPGTADAGNAHTFVVASGTSIDAVLDRYRAQCLRAADITAAATTLEQRSARDHPIYGRTSLRWVLGHMIEETARHLGHLDIMREGLDGLTGDEPQRA